MIAIRGSFCHLLREQSLAEHTRIKSFLGLQFTEN
ncbi:hypothetical protein SPAB_04715 [Salmonella enterica subsp. enterica serovar Paratyphi B str. SPB7]|uniref:Uncharacterized protein n=1 Tax=Salmonella paratyphi B (strain ATCC BAA-1250 / SPB7) TaxID=1016998 RepID=A0A6C6Z8Z8_SALPB|nr:hypothetical protein SPAB_04715 [Salmonella enterica subsp. enterica serovar Paratyphi B str. SPB7]